MRFLQLYVSPWSRCSPPHDQDGLNQGCLWQSLNRVIAIQHTNTVAVLLMSLYVALFHQLYPPSPFAMSCRIGLMVLCLHFLHPLEVKSSFGLEYESSKQLSDGFCNPSPLVVWVDASGLAQHHTRI